MGIGAERSTGTPALEGSKENRNWTWGSGPRTCLSTYRCLKHSIKENYQYWWAKKRKNTGSLKLIPIKVIYKLATTIHVIKCVLNKLIGKQNSAIIEIRMVIRVCYYFLVIQGSHHSMREHMSQRAASFSSDERKLCGTNPCFKQMFFLQYKPLFYYSCAVLLIMGFYC